MTRQSTKPPAHNGEDDSNGAPDTTYSMKTPWNPDAYFSPAQRPDRHRLGDGFGGKFRNTSDWADLVDEGPLSEYFLHDNQNANFNQFAAPQSFNPPHYPRICKRTIVLAGIPDNTTHEHVTKVVRGGILLEVYIKAAEHSAHVSFLHEEDAARFYDHSRKHNLYINHKRVSPETFMCRTRTETDPILSRSSSNGLIDTSILQAMLLARLHKVLRETWSFDDAIQTILRTASGTTWSTSKTWWLSTSNSLGAVATSRPTRFTTQCSRAHV